MDATSIGYSFSPTGRKKVADQANSAANASPVQQALRTISLRLPSVLGGSPFTPETNLRSQAGHAVSDPSAVVQSNVAGGTVPGAGAGQGSPEGEGLRQLLMGATQGSGAAGAPQFHPIEQGANGAGPVPNRSGLAGTPQSAGDLSSPSGDFQTTSPYQPNPAQLAPNGQNGGFSTSSNFVDRYGKHGSDVLGLLNAILG